MLNFSGCLYLFRQDVSWDPVGSFHENRFPIDLEVERESLREKIAKFLLFFYLFYIHVNCKRFLDKFHGPEEEIIIKSYQSSFTWTQLSWWRCPRLGWLTRWDHKAAELLHHLATRDQLGGFSVSSRFLSLHKRPDALSIKCVALHVPSPSSPLHSNNVEEDTISPPSDQLISVVPAVGGRLR